MKILKVNKAGRPNSWLPFEAAATLVAKGNVLWSYGSTAHEMKGGYNNAGVRSILDLPQIIAVNGAYEKESLHMSNRLLFARDRYTCLYCGHKHKEGELSNDHVIPTSKGGKHSWTNCVTACKRCNHHKADKTPEEAGMKLLAIPYTPTINEWFYLSNRNVLADQMDYLSSGFKNLEI